MMMPAERVEATAGLTWSRALLAVAILVSVWVGARGITREESFFVQGDPPRYLTDAAFLYDVLREGIWRPADVLPFAERYYARYPALSLGHHPPGLPASIVPFYAVFGVSVFAGRLAILAFFVTAVVLMYAVTRAAYLDAHVAGWASLLFASTPILGHFGQHLLAEMPTITWVLAALLFLERFCRLGGLPNYLAFIAVTIGTLFYRPTAVYMFPAYGAILLLGGGHRRLAERRVATASLVGLGLFVLFVIGFLAASPFNSAVVLDVVRRGLDWAAIEGMHEAIFIRQAPLAMATIGSVLIAVMTRDRRMWIPLAWITSVIVCAVYLTGTIEPGRYTVLAVPGLCLAAAAPMARARTVVQRAAWAVLLLVIIGLHFQNTWGRPTWDTPGYEAAARYIVNQPHAPTVLYSGSVDPGYFVFFVRKHDPERRMVIMRSDKVLTTSHMARLNVEDRIREPDEILDLLRTYGTRYVVIEDRPSGSEVLDWLRDIVKTDRFVERQRFPIGLGNELLDGVSLAVYEYLDATAPAPDAELDLNIVLIGRRIRVPLADLSPSAHTP